jgi:hypothetical protein
MCRRETGGARRGRWTPRHIPMLLLALLLVAPAVLLRPGDHAAHGAGKSTESPKKDEPAKKAPESSVGKPGETPPPPPADPKAKPPAPKVSNLKVTVSGGKKAIEQAEVVVMSVPPPGDKPAAERKGFTDKQGQCVFSALPVGTVDIRVIAKGWKTKQPQLVLKSGDNQIPIELEPQ